MHGLIIHLILVGVVPLVAVGATHHLDNDNSFQTQAGRSLADVAKGSHASCKPVGMCEMCTKGDRIQFDECEDTGRRQRYECIFYDGEG